MKLILLAFLLASNAFLDLLSKAVERTPAEFPERHPVAYRATCEIPEAVRDKPYAVEYYEYALQKKSQSRREETAGRIEESGDTARDRRRRLQAATSAVNIIAGHHE